MSIVIPGTAFATPRIDLADVYQAWNPNDVSYCFPEVFPEVQSDKATGEIAMETAASLLNDETMDREAGGSFNQIDVELAKFTITIRGKGLELPFNYDDGRDLTYNWEMGAARRLKTKTMINFERAASTILFASGLNTTSATAAWSASTGVPLTDIDSAMQTFYERNGFYPNHLILNGKQRGALVTNAQIVGRFPGKDRISYQDVVQSLADLFGITKVSVATGVYNTAKKGLARSLSPICPNTHCSLTLSAPAGAPLETTAVGRNYVYTDENETSDPVDMYDGGAAGFVFENYYWVKTHSEIYRVRGMKQINTHDTDLIQRVATGLT